MTSPTIVIVPGWRNSGPGHWQSLWADTLPNAVRVEQDDWVSHLKRAWVDRVSETIESTTGPVIVVAHSLGCIATVHLPAHVAARISGALLVAPADAERRPALADFAPIPRQRLPYPSTVVASSNDPYCPLPTSRGFAQAWGSDAVCLVDAGHINVDSGHGHWPAGLQLLARLTRRALAGAAQPAARPTPPQSIYSYRIKTKKQIRLIHKAAL